MREVLTDILKQTTSLFECIKVTAENGTTTLEATDKDAVVFLQGKLKAPVPEFVGQFGISNLAMLNGLLSFPSYNIEGSSFTVGRGMFGGTEVVTQFKFEDPNGGFADYRCVMPNFIPDQAEIRAIPWTVDFEPNRSRLNEFDKLQNLYSRAGGVSFAPKSIKGDMHFFIGEEDSNDHSASMLFEPGVSVDLKGVKFPTKTFLDVLKLAGTNPARIHFASIGVLKVSIETSHGVYDYIIRGSR